MLLFILPFLIKEEFYLLHLISKVYLNCVIVLGLVVILGFTKQFSLGQVAFYGIGAYTTAILTADLQINFFPACLISGFVAAISASLIAIPATRFQGPWLALVTFGFAEIIRILMIRLKGLTGGFGGFFNIPKPSIGGFIFDNDFKFYFIFLTTMLVVILVAIRLRFSPFGRIWISIGDQEDLSSSLGINVFFHKILAFAIGSFFAGVAGSLYAGYAGFISPPSFTLKHTIYYLCILIVGGLESIPGAIVAVIFFTIFSSYLMQIYPWDMVVLGLIIVVFVNMFPGGIGEWITQLWHRLTHRADESVVSSESGTRLERLNATSDE